MLTYQKKLSSREDYAMKVNRRILVINPEGMDLSSDQKRLQDEFHTDRLRLYWSRERYNVQVWSEDPNQGPYCIMTIDDDYSIGKVIHLMRERLISKRQLKEKVAAHLFRNQKDTSDKKRAIAKEMSRTVTKIARGRVTSSTGIRRP